MKDLLKANEFLKAKTIGKNEFRPSYHLSPEFGWCNDPHGIAFFHGLYHIFFQYNPYSTKAEEIFWGHVTTSDFIHFSETRCAIAPDKPYDNSGCWSGSSIVIDDVLYLVYTGFSLHDDGKYYQTVNLAYSQDGINFDKYPLNPIIDTKDIPPFASVIDFRDPCVFKKDGKIYIIVGSKTPDEKEAMLLLYGGDDIFHIHFIKKLVGSSRFGTMFECPNLVTYDDKDYIIMSPQNIKENDGDFANVSSCVYFPLTKDFIHEEQSLNEVTEIDHGLEYYAPTVFDEEKILVSWFQMWGRRYYLDEIGNDFVNAFSLFKKIERHGDKLAFVPIFLKDHYVKEIKESYLLSGERKYDESLSTHFQIKLNKDKDLLLNIKIKGTLFTLDCKEDKYVLDRRGTEIPLKGVDPTTSKEGFRYLKKAIPDKICLDIYVDNANIEIYFDDYEESFSFLDFSNDKALILSSNKPVEIELERENIEVR